MKKKFYQSCTRLIAVMLIITSGILFSEKAIGQSQDDWEDIESASNTAAILGALAGVCLVGTVVLLLVNSSKSDDDDKIKTKSVKKTNVKDSTSSLKSDSLSQILKSDTSSFKRRESGK